MIDFIACLVFSFLYSTFIVYITFPLCDLLIDFFSNFLRGDFID